jgi:hypothetical protein
MGVSKVPTHPSALRNFHKAAWKGSAFHELACDLYRGEEPSVEDIETPWREPYSPRDQIEALKRFMADFPISRTVTEYWLIAEWEGMRYGLTPDIAGWIGDRRAVVEIKTTCSAEESHTIQTAAQALALGHEDAFRGAVYVRGKDYKFKRHDNPKDFDRWKDLLLRFYEEKNQRSISKKMYNNRTFMI